MLEFEYYLDCLPKNLALSVLKFRIMNHKLPIENGRFESIDRFSGVCTLCNSNSLDDEFHYLFDCQYFIEDRNKYVQRYYCRNSNVLKLAQLMNSRLVKLDNFCQKILFSTHILHKLCLTF